MQILKNLAQFFAYSFFKILQISNNTTFYTNNNLHKNHHKYKAKFITSTCIPEITTNKFLLFFFTVYKNEKKKTQILTIKKSKKVTFIIKTKKYLIEMILMLIIY